MIVAPGTAAFAAAVAVARSLPVTRVSPGPCVSVAGSLEVARAVFVRAAFAALALAFADELLEEPLVAAPATPAPPITSASVTADAATPLRKFNVVTAIVPSPSSCVPGLADRHNDPEPL
jgi:hypothetical protein